MSAVLSERQKVMNREKAFGSKLPYRALLDQHTLKTDGGDFLQIIRIGGAAHESADISDINLWRDNLNVLLRNIASPSVALWTHTVRRETNSYPNGDFKTPFCAALNDKYRNSFANEKMLVNELYVTVIYRPLFKVPGALSPFIKQSEAELREITLDAIDKLNDITRTIVEGMSRYDPIRLGCYKRRNVTYSEPLEFLAYLANGEWQPMPLPRGRIGDFICTSRPFFGHEAFELRAPTSTLVGGSLAFKEYPSQTEPGMLNGLLSLQFPFVLTQSFSFISKQTAVSRMTKQRNVMENAGDLAVSQIDEIDGALDDLISGAFVMGEHHLSLIVLGENTKQLNERIAAARILLQDTGAVIEREDLALEAAFLSQFPCNFDKRPRLTSNGITSRNFAGFSSFHNYPIGRISGNTWGDAVALFRTISGAPYYFNFHSGSGGEESDFKAAAKIAKAALEESSAAERKGGEGLSPAHTCIIGPTGEGKTVVQGFLQSMLDKFGVTDIYFDKDRGLKIFIKAKGGQYFDNKEGIPTGYNPFQLDDTPANFAFLVKLIRKLVTINDEVLTPVQEKQIADAIRTVYGLPKEMRRIGMMLASLDPTDPNGVAARLQRWCRGGTEGWVFDNDEDLLDTSKYTTFGFDMTEYLDNEITRTPMMMYQFYRIRQLVDGRRLVLNIDEFQKALNDDFFVVELADVFATWRKLNAFIVFATQSPSRVLESKIGKIVVEQCVTTIFFPNPKGSKEDYVDGFKLTKREYEIIQRDMLPKSRRFLTKQGANSTICVLNLRGYDDELAILSGTIENVNMVENLIEIYGDDPNVWIPKFHQERKRAA